MTIENDKKITHKSVDAVFGATVGGTIGAIASIAGAVIATTASGVSLPFIATGFGAAIGAVAALQKYKSTASKKDKNDKAQQASEPDAKS